MNTVHGGAFSSNLIIYRPAGHPSELQMPWQMQSTHRLEFCAMNRAKFETKYLWTHGLFAQGQLESTPYGTKAQ